MSIYRGAGGAGDAVADSSSEALLIRQLAIEVQALADAAAVSETNAATSASDAADSATAAANSAASILADATAAEAAQLAASTSADEAAASALAASLSEDAAALSETNAAASEDAAALSESNAAASEDAAALSEDNAAASALAASEDADDAAISAAEAAASALAAQEQAESILNRSAVTITPTAGTTTLTATYAVGYEDVYKNGVRLNRDSDYTATTGTTIVLATASVAGDIYLIEVKGGFKGIQGLPGSIENSFEATNKNLDSNDAVLAYNGSGKLATITYADGVLKTLNYTGTQLTSVVLSGSIPSGILTTKTFTYNGSGKLVGVAYS